MKISRGRKVVSVIVVFEKSLAYFLLPKKVNDFVESTLVYIYTYHSRYICMKLSRWYISNYHVGRITIEWYFLSNYGIIWSNKLFIQERSTCI